MQVINLKRIAWAIGLLVDQICDDDLFHSRRVAVMAWRIGRRMKLPSDVLEDLLIAALIHDCGVSSPGEQETIITKLQWQTEDEHCFRGAEYIENCGLLKKHKNIVRYHHTPWNKLSNEPIEDNEKILANILFCVDRSYVGYHDLSKRVGNDVIINHKSEIIAPLAALGKDAVSPDVMAAFQDVARTDGFWLSLAPDFLDSALSPLNQNHGADCTVTPRQMRNIGTLISRLVDIKCRFTHEHSERVSVLATHLGEEFGLDDGVIQELEIAALLHDVGKQHTPEAILLKSSRLTDGERAVIRRHAIGSELILNMLFPESRMVGWATNHHEKLDGSGYPHGLAASELDICSRIVTVADIFQALTQERPYRGRMSPDDAIAVIGDMVDKGEVDPEVFEMINAKLPLYYGLSA